MSKRKRTPSYIALLIEDREGHCSGPIRPFLQKRVQRQHECLSVYRYAAGARQTHTSARSSSSSEGAAPAARLILSKNPFQAVDRLNGGGATRFLMTACAGPFDSQREATRNLRLWQTACADGLAHDWMVVGCSLAANCRVPIAVDLGLVYGDVSTSISDERAL